MCHRWSSHFFAMSQWFVIFHDFSLLGWMMGLACLEDEELLNKGEWENQYSFFNSINNRWLAIVIILGIISHLIHKTMCLPPMFCAAIICYKILHVCFPQPLCHFVIFLSFKIKYILPKSWSSHPSSHVTCSIAYSCKYLSHCKGHWDTVWFKKSNCKVNILNQEKIYWKNSDIVEIWPVQKLKMTMVPPPIVINLFWR